MRVHRDKSPCEDYWTIYISDHVLQVPGVPISGLADTLDEASTALTQAYDAMRETRRSGDRC